MPRLWKLDHNVSLFFRVDPFGLTFFLCSTFFYRKLATIVCTTAVAIQGTLFSEYDIPGKEDGEKHVFSDIQAYTRATIDRYFYGKDK